MAGAGIRVPGSRSRNPGRNGKGEEIRAMMARIPAGTRDPNFVDLSAVSLDLLHADGLREDVVHR